ncbi:MAG TPA: Hsp20/alpha crystallin family protein [Candidatus Binataceae bacterium]|nr:Hsp20/alpha crystallin family protein [Candidatus Binataceae bacterium]
MEVRYENGWNGMFDRMNRLMKDFTPSVPARHLRPAVDVVEDKDGYRFYFEVPGLKNESIDVRVENGKLILTAERKRPEWSKETAVHVAERAYGSIGRSFALPEDAAQDRVCASYKDGVLEVKVEKRPEAKPVKIQVN